MSAAAVKYILFNEAALDASVKENIDHDNLQRNNGRVKHLSPTNMHIAELQFTSASSIALRFRGE